MSERHAEVLTELTQHCDDLLDWMRNQAFPLWGGVGMHPSGAAWEALDFSGAPITADQVRVRVQARQIYVFALARQLGWQCERCESLLNRLYAVLVRGCRRGDGLFGKSYSLAAGTLLDDTFCLYDTAFAVLALAKLRGVMPTATIDADIASVLSALDAHAAHPDGGFYEEAPAPAQRLQNPHMHLFESLLALRDAGYSEGLDGRLNTLYEFISTTFFDADAGLVHERVPDNPGELTFEPGHSLEWTWLLTWYADYQIEQRNPLAELIYTRAVSSLDNQGFACMEATVSGHKTDPTCRLWSQAEALKAHASMALSPGESGLAALQAAALICQGIMQHWLVPAHAGGWHDHLDASGELCAANIPASTGYHLFGAVVELKQALLRLTA